MTSFQTLYKKLNKEQKEAVDTIDGPVMIIAGPGTGKTLTLTMRIANVLKRTDTDPQAVLALTFTESGAKAMRERLTEIIGPTAYYVNIYTFHSFCTDVIKEFSEIFLISEDTTPLSDLERIQLFREIIDKEKLDLLRPSNSPYYYVNDLIKTIQDLKRENVGLKKLEKLISDKEEEFKNTKEQINPRTGKLYAKYAKQKREIEKQKEVLKIYRAYQKKLKEANRFDFEDMINFVVAKLKKDENLKLTLQEKYLYILVDEYQDTNSAQNELLRLLTDSWESPNIFVVGDDEQSIFRFQGASLENILYFKNLFTKAKVITLTSNYRSSQYILDASRSLIAKNLLRLEKINKNLKCQVKRKNFPIVIGKFSNANLENQFIAKEIKKLIAKGKDPDEIAVLVRHNRDIDDLKDALSRENLRFEIASGKNILEDGDINRLLILLEVIRDLDNKPSDDIDFFTVLNFEFLNFKKIDVLKLARLASKEKENLLDIILNEEIFYKSDISEPEKFIKFANQLNEWQNLDANATFAKFFEKVIQESGFLNWILRDKHNISRINTINSLFDQVKRLNYADHTLNLEKFLENIHLMKENNIKIEETPLEGDVQAVKLLTAHKAKGLEFEYVFIAKCIDKKWGNNRNIDKIKLPDGIIKNVKLDEKEKNEDERRLFYVALTRTKKKVYITYAEKYTQGGLERQAVPSMFVSEIDDNFKENLDTTSFEKQAAESIAEQLSLPVSEESVLEEEDFLSSVISNLKLSVTALNTYLKCHYKFKINNILRTPRAKNNYLAFGSAIHKALEVFFRKFKKTHKPPTKTFLKKEFENALEKELLSETDFTRMLARGNKVLEEYFKNNQKAFAEPLYTEYSFGFRKVYLGDIALSGKIDRIDWIDKDKKEVMVIDYKTGTPKSRGEIEGKTKYSEGDLYGQILFYKLLSQLDRNFNFNVTKGEFDFLESKGNRKAKREIFEYSQEQIEDLKNTIRSEVKKIRNLEFERTKEYRHCENCDFKNHCWPDGIPSSPK